ncbi:MAG: hypothetical protein ACRBN8_44690 [Nannocystales bacterium]
MKKIECIDLDRLGGMLPTIAEVFGKGLNIQAEHFNKNAPSDDSPAQIGWSLRRSGVVKLPHVPILGALSLSADASPVYRGLALGPVLDLEHNLTNLKRAGKKVSRYATMLRNPNQFLQLVAETSVQAGLLPLRGDLALHNPTGEGSNKDYDVRFELDGNLLQSDVKWVQNWLSRDAGEDVLNQLDGLLGSDLSDTITVRFRDGIYREDDIIAAADEILDLYEDLIRTETTGSHTRYLKRSFPDSVTFAITGERHLLSLGMTVTGDETDRRAIEGNIQKAASQIATESDSALRAPVIATNLAPRFHEHVLRELLFGRDEYVASRPVRDIRGFPVVRADEIRRVPGLFGDAALPGLEHVNGVFYLGQWYEVTSDSEVTRKRSCRFFARPALDDKLSTFAETVRSQLDQDESFSLENGHGKPRN